jgi:hypothetical protein
MCNSANKQGCGSGEGCVLYFRTYESNKESLVELGGNSLTKRFFMLYTVYKEGAGQSVGSLRIVFITDRSGSTIKKKH